MSKELIRLSNCTMAFDDEIVLNNLNIYFNDQEFLTLLGPSGCGKTTTLRIIGGFLVPTKGDVFFDGVRINDVPPYKRQVNTVFQKYALFPHLNVFDNIAFGLKLIKPRLSKSEIEKDVLDGTADPLVVASVTISSMTELTWTARAIKQPAVAPATATATVVVSNEKKGDE